MADLGEELERITAVPIPLETPYEEPYDPAEPVVVPQRELVPA